MANVTTKRIMQDGFRNAIVALHGVLDTANDTQSITLGDFTNNDLRTNSLGVFNGFRIDRIFFSMSQQLSAKLEWHATTQQPLFNLVGYDDWDFTMIGGLQPNVGAAGYNGTIDLTTVGWASGVQVYSIILECTKLYK